MANHFNITNLGDITVFIKDGTHGTHKDVLDGPFLLSAQNVINGEIVINEDDRKISVDDFNAIHRRYKLRNDDVLVSIVGTLGKCALIKDYHSDYTFQRSVAIIRFDTKKILPKFAYYQMLGDGFQRELRRRESKGAQGGVYLGELEKVPLNVPDLETQQKIIQILDLSYSIIDKLKDRIALEDRMLNALCQKLLYSKKPTKRIEDVAKLVNGYAFKSSDYVENGKYSVLTIANVQKGKINLSNASRIDTIPGDVRPWQKLNNNDIVISMTGNVGRVARIDERDCLLNQRVGKIIPQKVNADYLYYLLSYSRFENKMRHQAQGGAQDNLSVKDINGFELYIPNDDIQDKIAYILTSQNNIIDLLKKELDRSKRLYKYLLNHFINGDLDLSKIQLEEKDKSC